MTSARRREPRAFSSGWIIAGVGLVVLAIAVVGWRRGRPTSEIARPTPTVLAPTPTPLPTGSPTPTATPALELGFTSVVVRPPPTTSATPTWPPAPPTRAPWYPSPTPGPSHCVGVRFTADQVLAPSAQVLIQIDAFNRCGRVLEAGELWFEIRGWRDGGVVRTVYGHAFDALYRGGSVQVAIGLPGSADWYDRIDVRALDAPP